VAKNLVKPCVPKGLAMEKKRENKMGFAQGEEKMATQQRGKHTMRNQSAIKNYGDKIIFGRIKRPIENEMCIIHGTTPVIYFGNYDDAKACTISINPSDKEFKNGKGELLKNGKERLCSREMLDISDNKKLSNSQAKKVIDYCKKYFHNNPYKIWFNPVDFFIKQFGYSYNDSGYDTCVHLDLVQWATDKWSSIPEDIKKKHLKKDLPILKHLLSKKDLKIMFLNGKTVVEEVKQHLNINLEEKSVKYKKQTLRIYFGKYNKIDIIGWNLVLAKIGGYENIKELCNIIKAKRKLWFN